MSSETEATPGIERTGRPARILAAARELAIRQGFQKTSMAEVAAKARVAKGTAYSYWSSKESLFLELIVTTFCEMLTEVDAAIEADPGRAQPGRLLVSLVETVHERELLRALFNHDDEVLGILLDTAEATQLVTEHGAVALIRELLPMWRGCGAAAAKASVETQTSALELLALGYLTSGMRSRSGLNSAVPASVLEYATDRILLGANPAEVADEARASVAESTQELLRRHISALASSVTDTRPEGRD